MQNSFKIIMAIIFLSLTFHGCEKEDDNYVAKELKVNDFIWKGMNLYYLWQSIEPDLSDERFQNQADLNNFLSNFSDPFALFQHLRVDPEIDRFSVMFSDYRVLEGVLSGTTENNGVEFGLRYYPGSTTEIFGFVRYIIPGSDAASKDIHRGDIFFAINGTALNINNYQSLLSADNYTLNLADYDNGNIIPNGQSVTLTKTVLSENPVLISSVINSGSHTIGYLMYNGFYPNYENELNAAFGQLASQNITDLVLDLRYNGGGSIATATRLASMITGQFSGQVFAREQWNAKAQAYFESHDLADTENYFTNTLDNGSALNSLNLSRVYVLTSKSTASASELVINGLEPYIDVIQIGDATTGKNVGSITLYDSPDFKKQGSNPDHKFALQPIVLKIVNKNGFGDYLSGLPPDVVLFEDMGNLGELGNESEPLLNAAINEITNSGRILRFPSKTFEHFKDSKSINPLQNEMYRSQVPDNIVDIK
ncbi:MAG TPA: S41 family peptidase [Flavobacterium sp.]|jgi:C-terminal processing protease CtpA/Prc